jgi:ABC-2 type transport system permease protein
MSPVGLIARREITTRLQQRGFRIGFLITLLVAVVACVLPALFRDDDAQTTYDVGVATTTSPRLTPALSTVSRAQHVRIKVHRVTAATAREAVRAKDLDAAVLPGGRLVARNDDDPVIRLVQSGYQLAGTLDRLDAAGLTGRQATAALSVAPLHVLTTTSSTSAQRQALAVIAVVFLFSQLITFCTWVAMGVVEEKASRVVELILSSVRPLQLLAGKLLGIGALAAGQVLLLGGAALSAATLADTLSVTGTGVVTLLVSFVGFLLGFAFFAALAAALGSTVSRQEEVSGILAPVTVTLTVAYFVSFAVTGSPDAGWARAISIIPPFSSMAMPARIARGHVPILDIVLAIALLVAIAGAITLAAARVYRASVLHTGSRVPLRRAWRGEGVAAIS